MTTCRDIITLGLQLGRVIPMGREPKASEAATGLDVLQGMYDGFFANGMFGRLTDVFKNANYTAKEGERIYNDGVTITIPTTITDEAEKRAPRDLSAIVVIASGVATNRVYSQGAWRNCSALTLNSEAPLAERDKSGLAALFAMHFVEAFGGELSPMWRTRALQFQGSLSMKLSSTRTASESIYY